MSPEELSNFEDFLKKYTDELFTRAFQSGKIETSDLVGEIKDDHKLILSKVENIDEHLKTLNGSVAKHNDKLSQHDIINAQSTIVLSNLTENIKQVTAISVETEKFKNRAEGSLNTFKWLFGFLGVGNVIMFLKTVMGLW